MAELGAGSGSGYPAALDTDINLEVNSPNADKTLARAEVPNDLASAIIAIQTELGVNPAGSLTDVKTFLQTEHTVTGTHSLAIDDLTDVNAGSPSDTQVITWNAATSKWIAGAGGTGSPGGANTYVQFNDSGSFGGDSGFVFNKTTNDVTILGNLTVGAEGGGVKAISIKGSDATGASEGGELQLYIADDYDTTYNYWRIDAFEDDLRFGPTGQTYVTFKDDGKVGVGMTAPNEILTVEGAISLDEISAPSPTAGYGKIYVKSSDSLLYFKDDGGTEYDLTAGGGTGGWTDDGTVVRLTTATDKVGVGTAAVPHGGIGQAKLAIEGPNNSANGPHVQITTDADDYPLLQLKMLTHDDISLMFDAYRDGAVTKSSSANANFQIYKSPTAINFMYDSGVAAGSTLTWDTGLSLDTTGLVTFINRIRLTSFTNSSPANGDIWYGSGDFWGYKAGVATSLTSVGALNDLTDVNAGTPSNNDALTWDSATLKWIPETISGASKWTDQTTYLEPTNTRDVKLTGTEKYDMVGGEYTPATTPSFIARTVGASDVAGTSFGFNRKAMWRFQATDIDDVDEMIFDLHVVNTSGAAQRAKTGIKVSGYMQPDNGGDVSNILSVQTGGGVAGTFYKAHTLRPGGYTNHYDSPQGALEVGTADGSTAGLFMSGMQVWGAQTYYSNSINCRLDSAQGKGIIITKTTGTFDTRPAIEIGTFQIDAVNTAQTFQLLLNGQMNITNKISATGYFNASPVNGDMWYDGTDWFVHTGGVTRSLGY